MKKATLDLTDLNHGENNCPLTYLNDCGHLPQFPFPTPDMQYF